MNFNQHFLRNSLKGYKEVLGARSLFRLRDLQNSLAETQFLTPSSSCFTTESCISHLPHERILRQYIYKNYLKKSFFRFLFYSIRRKNRLIYPFPKEWLKVLKGKNFYLNYNLSLSLWYVSLLFLFLLNIFRSFGFFIRALSFLHIKIDDSKYVYFSDINESNLPFSCNGSFSYTIVDWYLSWRGRRPVNSVRHSHKSDNYTYRSLQISHIRMPYFLISNPFVFFALFYWWLKYFVLSLIDLIHGRWWSLLLIYELLLAKACSFCSSAVFADDYLLPYSGLIYRPLWTYILESKGSRVITYFYSSYQNPSINPCDNHDSASWPASTWGHHLVWDSFQKMHLERNLENNPLIESVGSIWFCDSKTNLFLPEKSVAVFPIEFARLSYYMPVSTYGELRYDHPDYLELFINDIHSILARYDYTMVLKLKRNRPKSQQIKKNITLFDKLLNTPNVSIVDSSISPLKIFSQCKAVISMPFTSTAHYKEINTPNIYYDPTAWFDPNDNAAHGIPLLSNRHQLEHWLNSNVFTDFS